MNSIKNCLAGLVLAMLAASAAAQEGALLRYQPSKEPLVYRKAQTMKQTQNVMDKKILTETKQTEVEVWAVAAADKGGLEIKAETKTLDVKINIGPLGEYAFDSRKNDNEKGSTLGAALTPLYERLATARPTYFISDRGKIAKVEGLKELLEDVLKDNPLAKQFAAGYSDEAAKLGLSALLPSLPDERVAPGTRWEAPFELNLDKLGKATGKRIYTCDGEATVGKRKTIKISVAKELSFDLDLDMGGAKVTGQLSIAESKGTIHFDPKQGCIVLLASDFTLRGNLNVVAGGMNIPVGTEQVQSLRIELLERVPE